MNNDTNNLMTDNTETATIKAFTYKSAIIERIPDNDQTVYTEVVGPLKYLINFWRSLDLSLIRYEIDPDFSWLKRFTAFELFNTPQS